MLPLDVHVIPKIGKRPIEELDQHALREVLDPIWYAKPEAAAKALNRLNLTLEHAAALGLSVDLQAPMKARALLGKQRHETEHMLKAKRFSIQAAKPFFVREISSEFLRLRGVVDVVRMAPRQSPAHTATQKMVAWPSEGHSRDVADPPLTKRQVAVRGRRMLNALTAMSETPAGQEWLTDLRKIAGRFGYVPMASKGARRRRGRGAQRPVLHHEIDARPYRVRKRQ